MTEDDTFRILKRPTFREMSILIIKWYCDEDDNRQYDEILRDYGWTRGEYQKAVKRIL